VVMRFGELLDDAASKVVAHASERRAAPAIAALAPLLAIAHAYQRLPQVMPEQFTLVSQDLGSPTQLMSAEDDARVAAELTPIIETVASRFRDAKSAKVLSAGDEGERAMIFWAGLHGASQLQKLQRLPALTSPTRLCADTARTLLAGWGASTVRLNRARDLVAAALADTSSPHKKRQSQRG
jgi:hypothetical protein